MRFFFPTTATAAALRRLHLPRSTTDPAASSVVCHRFSSTRRSVLSLYRHSVCEAFPFLANYRHSVRKAVPCSPTTGFHAPTCARSHCSPSNPFKCRIDSYQAPILLAAITAVIVNQPDSIPADRPSVYSVSCYGIHPYSWTQKLTTISSSSSRFSWDIKSWPYTDGKGDQIENENSIRRWYAFQDNLEDQKSHKISKQNARIVFLSHLYVCGKDLCQGIEDKVIESDDAADLIVDAVYKRDPFSVVSMVYQEHEEPFSTHRNDQETNRNLEALFFALLAKLTL